jgi:hypothetical protein
MKYDAAEFLGGLFGISSQELASTVKMEPEADIVDCAAVELPATSVRISDTEVAMWDDCIDPPPPCPKCGGLELWESMAGGWQCMICDPPKTALRLLDRVSKLQSRN